MVRFLARSRFIRLATAAVPLAGLLAAPAEADARRTVAVCSGEARTITLPASEGPAAPRGDRDGGCAHFTCPRDRSGDTSGEDDED